MAMESNGLRGEGSGEGGAGSWGATVIVNLITEAILGPNLVLMAVCSKGEGGKDKRPIVT